MEKILEFFLFVLCLFMIILKFVNDDYEEDDEEGDGDIEEEEEEDVEDLRRMKKLLKQEKEQITIYKGVIPMKTSILIAINIFAWAMDIEVFSLYLSMCHLNSLSLNLIYFMRSISIKPSVPDQFEVYVKMLDERTDGFILRLLFIDAISSFIIFSVSQTDNWGFPFFLILWSIPISIVISTLVVSGKLNCITNHHQKKMNNLKELQMLSLNIIGFVFSNIIVTYFLFGEKGIFIVLITFITTASCLFYMQT